jgi:nicotine oxidoreductase
MFDFISTTLITLMEPVIIYLILIPLIGILVILFTNFDKIKKLTLITPLIIKQNSDTVLYNIALFFSLFNLLVSVFMWYLFNNGSYGAEHLELGEAVELGAVAVPTTQFQFIFEINHFSFGVDGISIFFVVRPLILTKPGSLKPITGLKLCKSTDLSDFEMNRGVEHVSEVSEVISYRPQRGEIISIQALIILPSQDNILASKITETVRNNKYVEIQNAYLSPLLLISVTYLKQRTKNRISDFVLRTGDLLNQVIGIDNLKILTSRSSTKLVRGDGVVVVPLNFFMVNIITKKNLKREGLQDTTLNINRTRTLPKTLYCGRRDLGQQVGHNTLIHSNSLFKTKEVRNYLTPTLFTRGISSKPLSEIDIYKKAYDILKSNPGNMTNGTDNLTIDGTSLNTLKKLSSSVKNWTYECKPTKRIYIKKANGKLRPLGIPTFNDKILQTAIKLLIEPKCEEIFHNRSFAFRPGRSIHQALRCVQGMVGITWMIEGDIKGYFDNIDHKILTSLIKEKINPDRTLMGLFQKIFKAGYLENSKIKHSLIGVPQGGIISPILSNLYLTPFDEFIDKLKEKYQQLPVSKRNPAYRKVEARIYTLRRKLNSWARTDKIIVRKNETILIKRELKNLMVKLRTLSSMTRVGSKLHYVRYADDWVVGVVGNKNLAIEVRDEIKEFLNENLKLELSLEKTKITHLGSNFAKFLGYYIRCSTLKQHISSRRINKQGEVINWRKSTVRTPPKLLVPLNELKQKLINKGLANDKGFPKYVGKFIYLSDYEIIKRYNSIIRGFMNFYNSAENRSSLGELIYIVEFSLAHTLAAKHRISLAKVFKKYGRPFKAHAVLSINNDDSYDSEVVPINSTLNGSAENSKKRVIIFDKPESLRAQYLDKKYSSVKATDVLVDPLISLNWDIKEVNILDNPCLICESQENVEMHHLRHLKDTKDKSTLIKIMSKIRRKMVPLCQTCHIKVHAGKYDGLSLKEVRNKSK